VTIPAGATLTIEPGTTLFFQSGAGLTVRGRLRAEGTLYQSITLTKTPGVAGGWAGLQFLNAPQESRLVHVNLEYANAGAGAIRADHANVFLDHVIWDHQTRPCLVFDNSSIVLRDSVLPDIPNVELVHFANLPPGGRALFEGNSFEGDTGYEDILGFLNGPDAGAPANGEEPLPVTASGPLVINEVLADNQSAVRHDNAFPDAVELYYSGSTALNLSGMSLSDDLQDPRKFVFGSGVTMTPGRYLVLYVGTGGSASDPRLDFGFDKDGDGLYLYDKAGALVDSVEFGAQLPDLSIGRVGPAGAWGLTVPTLGQPNAAVPLGDPRAVRINEWLAGSEVLLSSDFVELYNPGADPVDLGGMYLTDSPMLQGCAYRMRPLSFLAGHGYGLFWADDSNEPGHVNFRLSAQGETIALFDAQARAVDRVLFTPQTTDFSEGRAPDGSASFAVLPLPTPGLPNPQTQTTTATAFTLVEERAGKRVLVPTGAVSDDWKGGRTFNDSSWLLATGAPGGVGYEASQGYQTLISLDTRAQMYGTGRNNSCYIRIAFTVEGRILTQIDRLTLKIRYDDGFIAYLNGQEVARRGFAGTPAWNSYADTTHEADLQDFDEYIDISSYKGELKIGANILAIHGMNNSSTSSDFLISVALDGVSEKVQGEAGYAKELKLLDGLRITELMYRSPKGSSYDYVELRNILDEAIDVSGVRFDKGIDFVFPALTLQPGEHVVVAANQTIFRSFYGAAPKVAGQYTGNLSDSGEKIVLLLPAPLDVAILRFEYSNTWYPTTAGGGQSLTIQNLADPPLFWSDLETWHAADPTPGRP
jgi:hypothetical protein